jgi:hypothetical protein
MPGYGLPQKTRYFCPGRRGGLDEEKYQERRFFHAIGDGRFMVDGKKINHRKLMREKLPDGV